MKIKAIVHGLHRPKGDFAAAISGSDYLLLLIFAAGFVHATYYLLLGLTSPLLDLYSFRQTQTALSAYWIWRGGPWLGYETPVIGYPWAIPFEFPIYQWIVATLRMAGIPIDIGGRLVTFGFYVGCLWPLWSIFRSIKLPLTAFLIAGSLFLWSPIYVYWGRTVLIDTCALFFCVLWLALFARFLKTASIGSFAGAMVAGLVGILCKITTFPAMAALAGILFLIDAYRVWSAGVLFERLRVLALAVMLVIVPLVAEIAWVAFSDTVKAQNPLGALLTSKALFGWNFGTLKQRLGLELWQIILGRSLPDTFGPTVVAIFIVGAMALLTRRYTVAILAATLAFFIPFFLFTNLHMVHSFYQIANAIFAIAALSIAIVALAESWHKLLAPLLLVIFVCGQIYFFHRNYAPIIATDFSNDRILRISLLAREKTQPTDSLLVFGQDWSSVVAYYSERKTLTVPSWIPAALSQKMIENPQAFLGDTRLGGIVLCPFATGQTMAYLRKKFGDRMPSIDALIAGHAVIGEVEECQLFAPSR